MPNVVCPAGTKAWICRTVDCNNVKPHLYKTQCCKNTLKVQAFFYLVNNINVNFIFIKSIEIIKVACTKVQATLVNIIYCFKNCSLVHVLPFHALKIYKPGLSELI